LEQLTDTPGVTSRQDIEAEWYKAIIQSAPDGFVVASSTWKILEVNDSFCHTTGYRREELLGMGLADIGINCQHLSESLLETPPQPSEKQRTTDSFGKNKTGKRIELLVSYLPWTDRADMIPLFFRDITEQNEAFENLAKAKEVYRSLFENAPVAIWESDYSDAKSYIDRLRAQGITDFHRDFEQHPDRLLQCLYRCHWRADNKYARDLFGNEKDYLENIHEWVVHATTKEDRLKSSRDMMLALIDGEKLHVQEASFQQQDGGIIHQILECYIPPGFEETWSEVIVVSSDITQLKNVEEQLRRNQEHLEELVEERTDELAKEKQRAEELFASERKMYQALQEQIQQRIDFTRALVHELKTPLTPMLVASEILSNSLEEGRARVMAEEIYAGAKTLNDRIDELLDVARGEIGMLKLNPHPCDIAQIARDVSQTSAYIFLSRNQSFTVDAPKHLPLSEGDPLRIRQVIINLLDNASKYTPKGGEVTLRVKGCKQEIVLEVEDNGLGIPANKRKKLFVPYSTLAQRGQSLKGIGVGLALCKILIDLHGGKIWVKDNPKGKGCIFGFSLPLKEAAS
jgi:PAS domain S-box-containing protein